MAKRQNNHGINIPRHEIEALARVLLPTIQAFFESESGQKEFAEWKARQAEHSKAEKSDG